MADVTTPHRLGPDLPDDYFTPEAGALCARVKHKSYFHPGARSAEEALNAIAAILDHEDVVTALKRKLAAEEKSKKAFEDRSKGASRY